jgi:hypothetical protein
MTPACLLNDLGETASLVTAPERYAGCLSRRCLARSSLRRTTTTMPIAAATAADAPNSGMPRQASAVLSHAAAVTLTEVEVGV